jgi:hypothetical protein
MATILHRQTDRQTDKLLLTSFSFISKHKVLLAGATEFFVRRFFCLFRSLS